MDHNPSSESFSLKVRSPRQDLCSQQRLQQELRHPLQPSQKTRSRMPQEDPGQGGVGSIYKIDPNRSLLGSVAWTLTQMWPYVFIDSPYNSPRKPLGPAQTRGSSPKRYYAVLAWAFRNSCSSCLRKLPQLRHHGGRAWRNLAGPRGR